jgi:hypothetical protein
VKEHLSPQRHRDTEKIHGPLCQASELCLCREKKRRQRARTHSAADRFLSKHGRHGRFPPHPRSRKISRDTAAIALGIPLGHGGRKQFSGIIDARAGRKQHRCKSAGTAGQRGLIFAPLTPA